MSADPDETARYARRHLRAGWAMLTIFLTLGILLESMHGFKVRWYLDASNETRRLMFRLAHAHGALLGIVNILFALTLSRAPGNDRPPGIISPMLLAGSVLLPAGFLLGGMLVYGGDPSIGVILVPIGAALLIAAVGMTAWRINVAAPRPPGEPRTPPEAPRPARKPRK